MALPSSDPPPIPVSAIYKLSAEELRVTFDATLQTASIDPNNWKMWLGNDRFAAVSADTIANRMVAKMIPDGTEVNLDSVSYLPPPFDLISAGGIPAEAFDKLPVSVIP